MKHVDLEKFANGAFSAQVNRAIEEVTENIQNPNTDAGATRKITVTIAFKPNAERNFVATGVQTKTTLAPALGAVTAFSMGKNLQTGEVEAIEMGNQIPGQMSVNDVPGVVPENVVEVEDKAVDTDTGEIAQLGVLSVVDNVQNEMEKIESEQEKAKTDPVMTQMFGGAGDGKPGVLEEPGNGSKET